MALTDFPEIRVESVGDEAVYQLPRRPLGLLGLTGLLPIGFSAVWLIFIGRSLTPVFRRFLNQPQSHDYVIGAFLLCFLLAGCAPAVMGLFILFGRCRIRWRDAQLTVTERLGPFGRQRRMPRQPIRKFLVMGGANTPGNPSMPGFFGGLAALSAHFDNGAARTVVAGYPQPWLEAIAQDLSSRAGIRQSATPQVEVYQGLTQELAAATVEKPAGSPVIVERQSAGIVLEVPPAGIWKGSMGLIYFAIFWCLILGVITTGLLLGAKFQLQMIPIFALFWSVGLGVMLAAINLGRRRVIFTAGNGELTVVKSGLFGTKRFDFRSPDIAGVSVGLSNVQENHRPVPELQVRRTSGKKTGFLMGRDPDELRWIATELRNSLGLEAAPPPDPASLSGWPLAGAGPRPVGTALGKFLTLLIFAAAAIFLFRDFFSRSSAPAHSHTPSSPQVINNYLSNQPVPTDPALVFNAFGPANSSKPTPVWATGGKAHAEWFMPTMSGNLSEIKIALEPQAGDPHSSKATIFLTTDKNQFPGRTIESFTAHAGDVNGLLVLESVKTPALRAGTKYWLCVRSQGGWIWHFNDQNIVHNSAREIGRHKWASAGDYCYIGAFSIRVSTNQPPAQAEPPAADDGATTNGN